MEQFDLRDLRRSLARRLKDKVELEQQVRAVQSRYQAEIAPLQEDVLRLQMERLKEAAQAQMRSARLRNAYHDARDAYEKFREQRAPDSRTELPSSEDINVTYRRAAKLCHPDAVPDSYRKEAAATFQALESAHDANHPEAVRAIADTLETWGFPDAPSATPAQSPSHAKAALRRALADLDASIEKLRASGAYQITVAPDTDAEAAVGARKRILQQRLRELKHQRRPQF